jgi:hypothetical protein
MAWEIISRATIANLIGVSETILEDDWYYMAVGLIERRTGIHNIASPLSVTEKHFVWDFPAITVKAHPILAITQVSLDGVVLESSEYTWNSRQVFLLSTVPFDNNRKIAEVVFSSGTVASNYAMATCIAFVIKELTALRTMEGANTLIQFYRPGQSKATEQPLVEWGLHGKINGIIDSFLGKRFNAI